jgi:hypothetical protein
MLCGAPHSIEVEAAWQKIAKESGRDYWSVRLDDPAFAAPLFASLVETDDEKAFTCCGHAARRTDPRAERASPTTAGRLRLPVSSRSVTSEAKPSKRPHR